VARKIKHTFGTDPEAFVYKEMVETEFGKIPIIIPPAALIADHNFPMEQIEDKKVLHKGDGFQWSEDGAAIEMQIKPHTSISGFYEQVQTGIQSLKIYLKDNGELRLWINPLGFFDIDKYWKGRGEDFRMCVIFGCDPDQFPEKYVEIGLENPAEVGEIDVSNHSYRYGGAHVHIQAPKSKPTIFFRNWEFCATIFDFFAGMLNTTFQRNQATIIAEKARLLHYGKPGRIRLQTYNPEEKEYGIEYRVMSNSWLEDKDKTRKLLNTLDLAALVVENNLAEKFVNDFDKLIPDMYNTVITLDQKSAKNIFEEVLAWTMLNGLITTDDIFDIMKIKRRPY